MPIADVRMLGGKISECINRANFNVMGEIQQMEQRELEAVIKEIDLGGWPKGMDENSERAKWIK